MRILFVLTLMFLSSCAHYDERPITENVINFVRHINKTDDFRALHAWNNVLNKQPILSKKGIPSYQAMRKINDECNRKRYKLDPKWPTPNEFETSPTADCKGFAICKYYALRKAGFSADQLNLWSGHYNGIPHMILAVEINNQEYVLDVGSESSLPLASKYFYRNFKPVYRFNENGWDVN